MYTLHSKCYRNRENHRLELNKRVNVFKITNISAQHKRVADHMCMVTILKRCDRKALMPLGAMRALLFAYSITMNILIIDAIVTIDVDCAEFQ